VFNYFEYSISYINNNEEDIKLKKFQRERERERVCVTVQRMFKTVIRKLFKSYNTMAPLALLYGCVRIRLKPNDCESQTEYTQHLWRINDKYVPKLVYEHLPTVGRDSWVGIATPYRLDGPGIEYWWGRDFPYPSRPALGPTQPPVYKVVQIWPGQTVTCLHTNQSRSYLNHLVLGTGSPSQG
jgi:Txe/YoeB family toxin of Txe-Axe toxin-antitoxin module